MVLAGRGVARFGLFDRSLPVEYQRDKPYDHGSSRYLSTTGT